MQNSEKGKEEQLKQDINQKEQEIQRGVLKIDHLENDTKIMNGKIEQLRSDCRQQEKTKKDLAEQLRFQFWARKTFTTFVWKFD